MYILTYIPIETTDECKKKDKGIPDETMRRISLPADEPTAEQAT